MKTQFGYFTEQFSNMKTSKPLEKISQTGQDKGYLNREIRLSSESNSLAVLGHQLMGKESFSGND